MTVSCLVMQKHEDLQKAFTEAYDLHMEEIFRYFAYRLTDRERAKELTQETFMRAWAYASKGKEIRAVRPFLFTTASNIFKNELRDRKLATSLEEHMEATGNEPEANERSPDTQAEATLLRMSLERLEEPYKEVLRLRYFDELSPKEIGEMLGESENTISVRVHRALKKLKELHQPTP